MKKIISAALTLSFLTLSAFTPSAFALDGDASATVHYGETREGATARSSTTTRSFEIIERWNALSDKQRKTIYDLQAKVDKLTIEMAERYREYGVLSAEEVAEYRARVAERNSVSDGRAPGLRLGAHTRKSAPSSDAAVQ